MQKKNRIPGQFCICIFARICKIPKDVLAGISTNVVDKLSKRVGRNQFAGKMLSSTYLLWFEKNIFPNT